MIDTDPTKQPPLPKVGYILKSGGAIFMVWNLAIIIAIYPALFAMLVWRWTGLAAVALLMIAWATKETIRLVGLRVVMGPQGFEVRQGRDSLGSVDWSEIERVRERGMWLHVETKRHTEVLIPIRLNDGFSSQWLYRVLRPYRVPMTYPWSRWSTRTKYIVAGTSFVTGAILAATARTKPMWQYEPEQLPIYYEHIALLSLGAVLVMLSYAFLGASLQVWAKRCSEAKGTKVGSKRVKGGRSVLREFVAFRNPALDPIEMQIGRRYRYCAPQRFIEQADAMILSGPLLIALSSFCCVAMFFPSGLGIGFVSVPCLAGSVYFALVFTPRGRRQRRVAVDQFELKGADLLVFREGPTLRFPVSSRAEPKPNKRYSAPLSWCEQFTNEAGEVYQFDRRLIVPVEGDDG